MKDRQKKLEKRKKKQRKLEHRRKRKQKQLPTLHITLQFESRSLMFREDVKRSISRVKDIFWDSIQAEDRRACYQIGNRHVKMVNAEYAKMFNEWTSRKLTDAFYQANPQYSSYNYSFEVLSERLFHFRVQASVLQQVSTDYGIAHVVPYLHYPQNMKLGLTNHAIERLNTRLFRDMAGTCGTLLRIPLVVIPYKKNINALYFILPKMPHIDPVKKLSMIGLMGYLPMSVEGGFLIGITLLEPGFKNTPEKGMRQDAIERSRIITVEDGKLKMLYGDLQSGITTTDFVPPNPNANLLVNLERSLVKKELTIDPS